MPLPPATSDRRPCQRRGITIEVFTRQDGLWEVDAQIADMPLQDISLVCGVRHAGEYLHRMQLRLIVDRTYNVVDAGAETQDAPYMGTCENHQDIYRRLIGLNLLKGFRESVRERLGGALGCTHITELSQMIPSAIVQVMAIEMKKSNAYEEASSPPFQLDRCHALQRDTEAVRVYYPRWYRPVETASTGTTVPAGNNSQP